MSKKYDVMHKNLMDLLLSGELHSTLVGKIISVDHSDNETSIEQAEEFTEYIISLIKKANQRAKDVKDKR